MLSKLLFKLETAGMFQRKDHTEETNELVGQNGEDLTERKSATWQNIQKKKHNKQNHKLCVDDKFI